MSVLHAGRRAELNAYTIGTVLRNTCFARPTDPGDDLQNTLSCSADLENQTRQDPNRERTERSDTKPDGQSRRRKRKIRLSFTSSTGSERRTGTQENRRTLFIIIISGKGAKVNENY